MARVKVRFEPSRAPAGASPCIVTVAVEFWTAEVKLFTLAAKEASELFKLLNAADNPTTSFIEIGSVMSFDSLGLI